MLFSLAVTETLDNKLISNVAVKMMAFLVMNLLRFLVLNNQSNIPSMYQSLVLRGKVHNKTDFKFLRNLSATTWVWLKIFLSDRRRSQ